MVKRSFDFWMGFNIPISSNRTIYFDSVLMDLHGIGNGGLWYGFSSLLISRSCQAPIVPYNNSGKAFCSCNDRCLQSCRWHLLASLPSYTWYKVVFNTCSFALFVLLTRHSLLLLFYLGIEKRQVRLCSRTMIRSYIRGGLASSLLWILGLIDIIFEMLNWVTLQYIAWYQYQFVGLKNTIAGVYFVG